MPYPLKSVDNSDVLPSNYGTPSKPLPSYSVATSPTDFTTAIAGKNIEFFGKVFYNGNIDIKQISDLPTFWDLLILTGKLTLNGNILAPTQANIDLLKSKLKKGVINNFGDQLIFDKDDSVFPASNLTGGLFTGSNTFVYGKNLPAYCEKKVPGSTTATTETLDFVKVDIDGKGISSCGKLGTWGTFEPIKGGNVSKVTVKHDYAFIMAPIAELNIDKDNSHIYGVHIGGRINAGNNTVKFYPLNKLRSGLAGIHDENDLKSISNAANRTNEGVSITLRNMPLIISK
jgi:hypothetical protein